MRSIGDAEEYYQDAEEGELEPHHEEAQHSQEAAAVVPSSQAPANPAFASSQSQDVGSASASGE